MATASPLHTGRTTQVRDAKVTNENVGEADGDVPLYAVDPVPRCSALRRSRGSMRYCSPGQLAEGTGRGANSSRDVVVVRARRCPGRARPCYKGRALPAFGVESGRSGGLHELRDELSKLLRVDVVREVLRPCRRSLSRLPGSCGARCTTVSQLDDRIVAAPHDHRRHPLREVGAVEHGDDLAPPIHARDGGAWRMARRARVSGRASKTARISTASRPSAVSKMRRRLAPARLIAQAAALGEGHKDLRTGNLRRNAAAGLTVRPDAAPDENQTFASFGKLVGELRGDAAPEGVSDDSHPVHSEDRQEVPHAVGKSGDRVVGPRAGIARGPRGRVRSRCGGVLARRTPAARCRSCRRCRARAATQGRCPP